MNTKQIFGFIFFMNLLVFTIPISLVYAHPSLPTEFYGTIKNYNVNASTGTITAYAGNTTCGSFTIVNAGFYGVLSCIGQDTDKGNSIGAVDGQNITFRYNNNPTTIRGDNTFISGTFKFVNITYPVVYCGDGFCDALEDCGSCELDCGSCNFNGNISQNTTGNGTTNNQTTPPGPPSGGGSSSSSGAGGGGGSGGAGAGGAGAGAGAEGSPAGANQCNENWMCLNWSECSILGIRNRNCTDSNSCGTYDNKPKEVEECVYQGTCFDNLINCHDNKCEEGIDCGGPCDKKCPVIEQPLLNISIKLPHFEIPKHVCERHINLNDLALWAFLIIIFIAIIGRIVYDKFYIDTLRKNDTLTPLDRSKKIRSAKRKTLLFSLTLTFLTAVSLLYAYYFLLCPSDFFQYSWMLVLAIILIPLVIHVVMKKFEYNENRQIYKSKKLDDIHYQNLVKMIELENNMLADEENTIANKLYELSKREEFKEFLEKDQDLKEIYKNLVNLYTEYKEKKNPFNIERTVCDEINNLDSDELFKAQINKHPELKHLFDRLKKLYSQYEEKQKLYDKLDELEQSSQKEKSDKK